MPRPAIVIDTVVFPILDALQCLSYHTDEVVVPFMTPEVGYARLTKLYRAIYNVLERFGTLPESKEEPKPLDIQDFETASVELSAVFMLLFHDPVLGLNQTLFRQFTQPQRDVLCVQGAMHWNAIGKFLHSIIEPTSMSAIAQVYSLLDLIQGFLDDLKESIKVNMVQTLAFQNERVLERSQRNEYLVTLGFDRYVLVRKHTLHTLRQVFAGDEAPISSTLAGAENEATANDFLTFPGTINFKHELKALVDTGAKCNLISREWIEQKKIPIPESSETQVLKYADGSSSAPFPIIEMRWSYKSGKKAQSWRVKFIVMHETPGKESPFHKKGPKGTAALIGLPLLKETQLLHSRDGKLIFPELSAFARPSEKDDGIPLYYTDTSKTKATNKGGG